MRMIPSILHRHVHTHINIHVHSRIHIKSGKREREREAKKRVCPEGRSLFAHEKKPSIKRDAAEGIS